MQHTGEKSEVPVGHAGSEHGQHNHRWCREGEPCRDSARETRAQPPNRNCHLTRGRSGQELAERHQIGEVRRAEPFSAGDELGVEIAEMRHRPTEAGESKAQENEKGL